MSVSRECILEYELLLPIPASLLILPFLPDFNAIHQPETSAKFVGVVFPVPSYSGAGKATARIVPGMLMRTTSLSNWSA